MQNQNSVINTIIFLIFVSVGVATIFYQIHFDDLWFDEMNSFYVADPSLTFKETISRHNDSDWHNPKLFNLILKFFFIIVGYDPYIARYLPLIFGSISILMFGIISYQIRKDNSFLLTTFLACVSIYIIKYSQELRPYSLLLLTSTLNIFFYIKLLNNSNRKITNSLFFVFFSVLNYSSHPFSLIILFSQITFSIYKYFLLKKPFDILRFLYPLIFILYLIPNLNYILLQISFSDYMLSYDVKNIFDGFYFPRYFGSKIMGYFYLALIFFLIFINKKVITSGKNNYLFFLILLIFSFLIPFIYGLIRTPVLHDRYIIFVLIPIIILISCLISELSNKKLKFVLIFFVAVLTLSNHYIEIFKRLHTKPQFSVALNDIKKSNIQNIVLFVEKDPDYLVGNNLVTNYVHNINIISKTKFNFYQLDDLPKELKNFWLVCYNPNLNYECKIPNNFNYNFLKTKKYFQVESSLYKLK